MFNEWRKKHEPRMRRSAPVGIIRAGSSQTVLGCICGETHSYSAKWPKPKHAYDWEEVHNTTCKPEGVS